LTPRVTAERVTAEQSVRAQSRVAGVQEYIVERDNAGTDPREPADALDTAAVGYQFLRNIRF